PHRYTYPKWERLTGSDGKVETKRVEINGNGRPYVFKREKFLSAEEITSTEVNPENEFLNAMTPPAQIPQVRPDSLPF
ncbi:MAG TPA: hypothetical protein PL045_11850, partial [Chitinophagaceae bacterium]|nr:hypothetical protein [Chitinophagaceae bacterium]